MSTFAIYAKLFKLDRKYGGARSVAAYYPEELRTAGVKSSNDFQASFIKRENTNILNKESKKELEHRIHTLLASIDSVYHLINDSKLIQFKREIQALKSKHLGD